MIAAYLAGATQVEAAALFGYDGTTCGHVLRRRGIVLRTLSEAFSIPKEHEEAIVAAYLEGATQAQAAALFGYSGDACLNALKRRGIVPRSFQEVARRYTVDETFFDQIDTEEKAYWLGFLTADGGIARNRILPGLKVSDIGHLHKFVASLESDHPVTVVMQLSISIANMRLQNNYAEIFCNRSLL